MCFKKVTLLLFGEWIVARQERKQSVAWGQPDMTDRAKCDDGVGVGAAVVGSEFSLNN